MSPDHRTRRPVRSRRRLILAAWLVAGVAALTTMLTVSVARPVAITGSPILDRPAPLFDLEALDGRRVALADLRGSAIVLNFWASWCTPCRDEAPLLTEAGKDYEAQGLRMLGVLYQDDADGARDFMARYGQSYPGLLDPAGETAIDYGVIGVPETYFIDRAGIVRARQVGPVTEDGLRRLIEDLLR